MKYSSLSAVFPAYNEEKNLEILVKNIDNALKTNFKIYEIIIVNDGSDDNSLNLLYELQKKYIHLKIISHEKNFGYGAAVKSGLCAAKHELIFFSDSDNQFDLSEIKNFLPDIEKYDVVVGYRIKRKDGIYRIINSWIWNKLNFLFYKIDIKDIDCAYKLFTKSALEKININNLKSKSPMINPEILIKLKRVSAKIKQTPISHFPRTAGKQMGGGWKMISRSINDFITLYQILK